MTKQASFKKIVRQRMLKTGERYSAARKQLLAKANQATPKHSRTWLSEPELSEDSVLKKTGKNYDHWCDLIEDWLKLQTAEKKHKDIAAFLQKEHNVDAWWAQGITVGFERITGRRLPYQRQDGSFTASKSKVLPVIAEQLRELLINDEDREDLFPNKNTKLLSKPNVKALRIEMPTGIATIRIDQQKDESSKVAIEHNKLETYDSVKEWKFYWDEWFDAIDSHAQPNKFTT